MVVVYSMLMYTYFCVKESKSKSIETEKVTIVPQAEKLNTTSSTGILRQRLGTSSKAISGSNPNIIRLKPSASERYKFHVTPSQRGGKF